jgi:hypothetical protein
MIVCNCWMHPIIIYADLKGSALVYAKDGNKILLGSLFGYNGEESEQNYVAMTFTLDVEDKTGIATVTIGTDDGNGNRPVTIQFGTNSSKYKEAIQFLGDKSNKTRNNSRDVDDSTDDTPISPAVDTGIYERQTVTSDYGYGNFEAFSFFSNKEMNEGTSILAIGKAGCNTANAEEYIVDQIQSTAMNVSPRKLEGIVRARSNGFYCSSGENIPKNSETTFIIDIPLPYDLSYTLEITLASTTCTFIRNSSYTVGSYHTTKWNFYDVSGLNELEATPNELSNFGSAHKGIPYENRFYYGIDVPTGSYVTRYIDGYGSISFFYMYYDDTGNLNNAYWTSSCTVADQPVKIYGI